MPTAAVKRAPKAPASDLELKERRGPNTLTNEQKRAFQEFLENWILVHSTETGGKKWSDRQIAKVLELSQNELSRWRSGKAAPGLQRLIHLRKKTGASVEAMLGLE